MHETVTQQWKSTLREKKQQQSRVTWKTEKELQPEIKNNGEQFSWKKNMKILKWR